MPRLTRLKQPTEFTWKRYSGTLGVVHLTDDRDSGGIVDGKVVSLCHRRGMYAGHDTRPRRIVQQWSKLGNLYEGVPDTVVVIPSEVIWRPHARLHRCGTCAKIALGRGHGQVRTKFTVKEIADAITAEGINPAPVMRRLRGES